MNRQVPLRSIGDYRTSDCPVFPEKQGGIASQAIKPDPSADITITDPHGDQPHVDPAPGTESDPAQPPISYDTRTGEITPL